MTTCLSNLNESVQLHTSTQDSEDNWKCTASPVDGGAVRKHRLAGPNPAIATSLRVQANEAPAHGFSGGPMAKAVGVIITRFGFYSTVAVGYC